MIAEYPRKLRVAILPDGNIATSEDGKVEFIEMGGRFLNIVLTSLGHQYDFVFPKEREQGRLLPDGNWSGLIGMIQRGEADLAYSYLGITESRTKVVEFSTPYVFDELTFVSRIPENRRSLLTSLYPFDQATWFGLILAFCLVSLLLSVSENHISRAGHYAYRLFGSSLGQSIKIEGDSVKFNYLVMFWMFSVRVIVFSYSGTLLSFLIQPLKEDPIRNYLELSKAVLRGSHQANFSDVAAQYLFESDLEYLKKLGKIVTENKWIANSSHLNPDTYIKPNFCLGINRNFGNFLFGARSDLYFSEDRLYLTYAGFAFNKRFCCISKLNAIISRAASAGLFEKLLKDESTKLFIKSLKSFDDSETLYPLSLDNLLGPIILLGTGLSAAFVIFLAEVIHSKYVKF